MPLMSFVEKYLISAEAGIQKGLLTPYRAYYATMRFLSWPGSRPMDKYNLPTYSPYGFLIFLNRPFWCQKHHFKPKNRGDFWRCSLGNIGDIQVLKFLDVSEEYWEHCLIELNKSSILILSDTRVSGTFILRHLGL